MDRLKPCPVCESEARIDALGLRLRIRCSNALACGIYIRSGENEMDDELVARWNALPRQCAHEWIAVSDGPNMPSHGECSKCGSRMGTVHG